jgi:sulfatase modifying factor 1
LSRASWGLAAAAVLAACGGPSAGTPQAQVVLHIDTDAPVVSEFPGAVDWTAPIPLFDRLRVDVYPPGATDPCDTCFANEFSVSAEEFAASTVSFGAATGEGESGWIARVRLTAQRFESSSGELDRDTTIDVYVALPTARAGQVIDAGVNLPTDAVGVVSTSLVAPVPATLGRPVPSQVGTWPSAQRGTCTTGPYPGAVCVPGGAYWMGGSNDHLVSGASPSWHRLVVVSPFWLDETEVTVGTARSHGLFDPDTWTGNSGGTDTDDWCTYTTMATSRDPLPVECISWRESRDYCASLGGRLPTEAQFEYAQGGALGTPYPWGRDPPSCSDAIWGRNGFGAFDSDAPTTCRDSSNFLDPMGGPEPPRHGARDALVVPGGRIYDLAGNVEEYALDAYEQKTGMCWSTPGILSDPLCTEGTDPPATVAVRGGSWTLGTSYLEAPERASIGPDAYRTDGGFRCAYPGD